MGIVQKWGHASDHLEKPRIWGSRHGETGMVSGDKVFATQTRESCDIRRAVTLCPL